MISPEAPSKRRSQTLKNSHASAAIADISKLLAQMSDMQKKLETHRNEQLASKKVERKKVASQKAKNVASMKVKQRVVSPQKVFAGPSRNDQRDNSDTDKDSQESESDDEEDEFGVFGVLCCLTTPGLRKDIRRQIRQLYSHKVTYYVHYNYILSSHLLSHSRFYFYY